MNINFIARVLLSLLFLISGSKSITTGDIQGSVNYVKSVNWPFAKISVILSIVLKIFIAYSLIVNKYLQYSIPMAIIFLLIVMYLFNNPFSKSNKLWMFLSLCGVIGGLLLLYPKDKFNILNIFDMQY